MIKKFTRKTGLSFYTKIKLLDGKVISRRSPKKTMIYNFLKANKNQFKWVYIKVTYKPKIYNDGKYKTGEWEELMRAWKTFTEESFIREVIAEY